MAGDRGDAWSQMSMWNNEAGGDEHDVKVYERIYSWVMEVPAGYVTTYGTVAQLVGCTARQVGYAMHYLSYVHRPEVPWQRVINSRGMISTQGNEQRRLLEAEGIEFSDKDVIDLKRCGWRFQFRAE